MSSAVSIPSRVIISSVNRNTPANAFAPVFNADDSSLRFDFVFQARACRHM